MILPNYAQTISSSVPSVGVQLPKPGSMVPLSPASIPPVLKGLRIHPQDPFRFDFIMDRGEAHLEDEQLQVESKKLIRYFLAALTIPEDDLWVNLSPHEPDRIIPEEFGQTEMGGDLLAQDYLLKQLTASLLYPEEELGKRFWKRVREQAYQEYGVTEIPMDAFHKVWIVPDQAIVYENGSTAFVAEGTLKVMVEEDYVAMQEAPRRPGTQAPGQSDQTRRPGTRKLGSPLNRVSSEILRELILPEIEKEINDGERFTPLRQIYHSLILASWFKKRLKESIVGQIYVNRQKIKGVDVADKEIPQKIYQQYLKAYQKGVYHYIKEEYDPTTQQLVPRQYFSGGVRLRFDWTRPDLRIQPLTEIFGGAAQDTLRRTLAPMLIAISLFSPGPEFSRTFSPEAVNSIPLSSGLQTGLRHRALSVTDHAMLTDDASATEATLAVTSKELAEINRSNTMYPIVGKTVGPYKIVRHLDRGGTSQVYLAEDQRSESLGKKVVLKVSSAPISEMENSFAQERDMLYLLQNARDPEVRTHYPRIFDEGVLPDGQGHYLVLEYFEKEKKLYNILFGEDGRLKPVAQAVASKITTATLKALAPLHDFVIAEKDFDQLALLQIRKDQFRREVARDGTPVLRARIFHGDITLSNVFFREDGEGFFVRLLDFGNSNIEGYPAVSLQMTLTYRPPEAMSIYPNRQFDLYAVFIMDAALRTGDKRPFPLPDTFHKDKKIDPKVALRHLLHKARWQGRRPDYLDNLWNIFDNLRSIVSNLEQNSEELMRQAPLILSKIPEPFRILLRRAWEPSPYQRYPDVQKAWQAVITAQRAWEESIREWARQIIRAQPQGKDLSFMERMIRELTPGSLPERATTEEVLHASAQVVELLNEHDHQGAAVLLTDIVHQQIRAGNFLRLYHMLPEHQGVAMSAVKGTAGRALGRARDFPSEDQAMIVDHTKGGIDFQPEAMDLNIEGEGNFDFSSFTDICVDLDQDQQCDPLDAQTLESFAQSFEGFTEIRILETKHLTKEELVGFMKEKPLSNPGGLIKG